MSRKIVDRVCAIMLGFILTIALCPGINAMAATSFYGGINYFVDGSKNGYFNGAWVDGFGGDIMFSIGGHGLYDELTVDTSTRVVEIKNLVPDLNSGDGDLWFNPSMVFSNYRINLNGNNKLTAMIIGASDFTITVEEGSELTIIGTASAPAITGNGIVRIGENTRAILTNASGKTILNAGETLPTDGPLEQKVYTKAEFIGLIDLNSKKSTASLNVTSVEYTGSAIEPIITIPGLTKDTDFTVSYSDNVNVGTAKVTVTGIGRCKGAIEIPFTINPMPIEKKKTVAALSASEFEYTGNVIEPEVTITGLTKGTDYTVAYEKNIDPGTAVATVTGAGNYNSSFTLEFTIKKTAPTAMIDNKTGANYLVTDNGDTAEATYTAPKTKNEKTIKVPDEITLPDGKKAKVTAIENNAFKKNTKLTSATVGNNVKTVGDNAFNGCSKLTNLKLGKNVETIGNGAVSNCKSLKNLTVPASTKTIGKNAFKGDSNLTTLTINCKNLKSVGKDAIKNINPKATIKLKGNAKQKKAAEKLITKKNTGYKKTMKIKK